MNKNINFRYLLLTGLILFFSSMLVKGVVGSSLGMIGIVCILSGLASGYLKKSETEYKRKITPLESRLKDPNLEIIDIPQLQEQLADLADKYQYDKSIGKERYLIYELQALIFFYQYDDDKALKFLDLAVSLKESDYSYARSLKSQILNK